MAGGARVGEMMMPTPIILRQATLADCDLIHAWRNAEETRRYIFDPRPFPLKCIRSGFERCWTIRIGHLLIRCRSGNLRRIAL